jgi:hypothetical protein
MTNNLFALTEHCALIAGSSQGNGFVFAQGLGAPSLTKGYAFEVSDDFWVLL